MDNKNTAEIFEEYEINITGEKTETASIKVISKKFKGVLPNDGNIYYYEITPNCLALISSSDVFFGNRVIGTGLDEKVTDILINEIINFYKRFKKEKFFIQVPPLENFSHISELLLQRGGELRSNWVKLVKIPEAGKAIPDEITIRVLQKQDHETVVSFLLKSFSFPEELKTFCLNAFVKPGWNNYVAVFNDKVAGTGSLYIKDGIAEIGIAATVEEARGKGIQSALINFRERIAFEKGCKYLFVETAEPTSSYPAPSYRNMIRLGFTELYRRPNYLIKL